MNPVNPTDAHRPPTPSATYSFGPFTLDTPRRQLYRREGDGSSVIHIRPQVFELLLFLIRNRNRAVTKEEVWNALPKRSFKRSGMAAVYDPNHVDVALGELRQALGETPDRPICIKVPEQNSLLFDCPVTEGVRAATDSGTSPVHFQNKRESSSVYSPLTKGRSLSELFARLRAVCGPNDVTKRVMRDIDADGLSVDGCFELLHSYEYLGWTDKDIEFQFLEQPVLLPSDLQELTIRFQPSPPSHGKYRLYNMAADTSERPTLQIQLAPTTYFEVFPIQRHLFEPLLTTSGSTMISPFDKYHADLLDFGDHPIPNLICLHVLVVMGDNKLLLSQRMKKRSEVDWQLGKWCSSFEENMTVKPNDKPPRIDRDFFDAVYAGLWEELGVPKEAVDDIRILSIVLETDGIVVDPIAFVRIRNPFEEVEAHWALKARDGARRELRKVDWVEFELGASLPILTGKDLQTTRNLIRRDEWHVTSRMRLLAALFHSYGIEQTLSSLP